ncbi:ATP-dependent DNA helicase [Trichonephila clavata]|uniref:ATP-dependent DNA helicase n=1 Tax=Trichonephila clavata TaxID=2740835 RepID=A0A8X6F0R7_TRICU|nr:ATP-dependent DNA helicase [Trichonephila clavata]
MHIFWYGFKKPYMCTKFDDFISAEIPNPEEDPELFNCITTQMVHGPCGAIKPFSPCMKDGKCTKRYPRDFLKETQTGKDGYPLYRRRRPEDGGFSAVMNVRHSDVVVDNRWIVHTALYYQEYFVPISMLNIAILLNRLNMFASISTKDVIWPCLM